MEYFKENKIGYNKCAMVWIRGEWMGYDLYVKMPVPKCVHVHILSSH